MGHYMKDGTKKLLAVKKEQEEDFREEADIEESGNKYLAESMRRDKRFKGVRSLYCAAEVRQRWSCDVCPYSTDKQGGLLIHQFLHRPQAGNVFKCKYCPYYVSAKRLLFAHTRLHRKVLGIKGVPGRPTKIRDDEDYCTAGRMSHRKTGRTRYFCRTCPYISCNRKDYVYHRQFHRPYPTPTATAAVGGVQSVYECHLCPYWVNRARLLAQHAKVHTTTYVDKRIVYARQRGVSDYISPSLIDTTDATDCLPRRTDLNSQSDIVSVSTMSRNIPSGSSCQRLLLRGTLEDRNEPSVDNIVSEKKSSIKRRKYDESLSVEYQDNPEEEAQSPSPNARRSITGKTALNESSLPSFSNETEISKSGCDVRVGTLSTDRMRTELRCTDSSLGEGTDTVSGGDPNTKNYSLGSCTNRQSDIDKYLGATTQTEPTHISSLMKLGMGEFSSENTELDEVATEISPLYDPESPKLEQFYDEARKLYCCDRCPYTNMRRDILTSHQRFHSTRSEFGCHMCDYSVTHLHLLIQHVRMHGRVSGVQGNRGRRASLVDDEPIESEAHSEGTTVDTARGPGLAQTVGRKRKWNLKEIEEEICSSSCPQRSSEGDGLIDMDVNNESVWIEVVQGPMKLVLKTVYMAALELKPTDEQRSSLETLSSMPEGMWNETCGSNVNKVKLSFNIFFFFTYFRVYLTVKGRFVLLHFHLN